jgi:hypothetical protein
MNKKLFFLPFFLLLLISSAFAFFPDTHTFMLDRLCESNVQSSVKTICCNNYPSCLAGVSMVDISVVYYFTEFQKYEITHSPSYCNRMIQLASDDETRAFAYGTCIHQLQDSVSHNYLVPYSISHTAIPNTVVHIFAEERLDDIIEGANPTIVRKTRDTLNIMKTNNYDNKYMTMLKGALLQEQAYNNVDVVELTDFFIGQVQTSSGYKLGFSTMWAVPTIVYVILFGLALVCGFGLYYIFSKRLHGFGAIGLGILCSVIIAFVILAVYGVASGSVFNIYEVISTPISAITPIVKVIMVLRVIMLIVF